MTETLKKIVPADLVPLDLFADDFPLIIDLAYTRKDNLLLGEAVYRPEARLWLYEDLAAVVLLAARFCHAQTGKRFVLYDGLRTTEAQSLMLQTRRVQDNPHWLEEPRLLSPPGAGGHPRGMAVDISLEDADMGTAFDHLAENPHPNHNPAHREYEHLSEEARHNRGLLTGAMMKAADSLDTPLLPLPQEWWDFRLPPAIYDSYAPLSDSELPPQMRMAADTAGGNGPEDLPDSHFTAFKDGLLQKLARFAPH